VRNSQNPICERAEPYAASLIESLRNFGYDLPTAIADLIDNSIFAGARNVWVDFTWDGATSCVCVTDDGKGMTERELSEAMRHGSKNPLEDRDPKDLGRFGIGLKTASFSQARRLTVRSKLHNGTVATRCWDLDYVQEQKDWLLLKQAGKEAERLCHRLGKITHGTSVLWEQMDRIVAGQDVDNEVHHKLFLERVDTVKAHLAMVFHRFMEGRSPLLILINSREVEPWDPFLTDEKATQQLAEERIKVFGSEVNVVPYVLPHVSKLNRKAHERGAGIRGWNAHQGFYVYRNKRLLVPGDWLGLPYTKDEHCKLARIRIDIPNSMDQQWEIDVKKSKTRPPDALRPYLKGIADKTRKRASDIYRHRGKVIARENAAAHVFAWEKRVKHGKIFYSVNREHPLVKDILLDPDVSRARIDALLRLLEETVPVAWIVMNNAESPDQQSAPFEKEPSSKVLAVMREVFGALLRSGLTRKEAVYRIATMEPFDRYPECVEALRESSETEMRP